MKTKLFALVILPALLFTGCASDKNPFKNFKVFTPSVATTTNGAGTVTATTNYAVSDTVQTGIAAAHQITPYVPAPFGSAVDLALVAATGILGFIARVKSKKAALVPALIRGIEAAGNADVKTAVQTEAQLSGVQAALHAEVKKNT